MIRIGEGETEWFDLLLRRHRKSLVHFLSHMVNDAAIAEDLAQDAFLTVYRARASYRPSAQFTAWLYRIARNRAINWVRDNRRHRATLSLEEFAGAKASPGATPEQVLLASERRKMIRRAVDGLPERQRVAVLLHKYAEMDYVENRRGPRLFP